MFLNEGFFTVIGPKGGHRTLKIQDTEDGSNRQWLSYLCGPVNTADYKSVGFIMPSGEVRLFRKYDGMYPDILAAARFLVKSARNGTVNELGKQYAAMSGNCWRCDRVLTTPESIERGIGPVCADKIGM